MVCPGKAMTARVRSRDLRFREQGLHRFRRPLGDLRVQPCEPGGGFVPWRASSAPRICGPLVVVVGAGDEVRRSVAWVGPSRRTSAASMPSSEVPDMSPTARRDARSCAAHRGRIADDGAKMARVLRQQPLGLLATHAPAGHDDGRLDTSVGRVEHGRAASRCSPVVSIRIRWLRSTSLSFQARRSTIRLP